MAGVKGKSGGKREGTGRPKVIGKKTYTRRLPIVLVEAIEKKFGSIENALKVLIK